jgi:hypothetical protein
MLRAPSPPTLPHGVRPIETYMILTKLYQRRNRFLLLSKSAKHHCSMPPSTGLFFPFTVSASASGFSDLCVFG